MNFKKCKIGVFLAAFFFIPAVVFAQTPNNYKIELINGSKIWIEGDSTLHTYKCESTSINLDSAIALQSAPVPSDGLVLASLWTNKIYSPELRKLTLEMPVKNFHSNIAGLNSNFNKTLKYKEYPAITFTLSKYSVEEDKNVNNRFVITIDGILKIAGKEKPVSISSVADVKGRTVKLVGKKDLLMTDFSITPPKLLFITTDDKITIKWELLLTIAPLEPVSPA